MASCGLAAPIVAPLSRAARRRARLRRTAVLKAHEHTQNFLAGLPPNFFARDFCTWNVDANPFVPVASPPLESNLVSIDWDSTVFELQSVDGEDPPDNMDFVSPPNVDSKDSEEKVRDNTKYPDVIPAIAAQADTVNTEEHEQVSVDFHVVDPNSAAQADSTNTEKEDNAAVVDLGPSHILLCHSADDIHRHGGCRKVCNKIHNAARLASIDESMVAPPGVGLAVAYDISYMIIASALVAIHRHREQQLDSILARDCLTLRLSSYMTQFFGAPLLVDVINKADFDTVQPLYIESTRSLAVWLLTSREV